MLLQDDGRIVMSVDLYTYRAGQPPITSLPCASAGERDPDATFGTGGISMCQIGETGTYATYIELQPDDSILTAGNVYGLPAIYSFYGGDFAMNPASDTGITQLTGSRQTLRQHSRLMWRRTGEFSSIAFWSSQPIVLRRISLLRR